MNEPDPIRPVIPSQFSPGQLLRIRREEKGMTVEEMASRLRLRVDVIESLESDNYENLPEATFVRGYMRSCAKLLDMNPDQLMGAVSSTGPTPEASGMPAVPTMPADKGRDIWRKQSVVGKLLRWVIMLGVFVVVVMIVTNQ